MKKGIALLTALLLLASLTACGSAAQTTAETDPVPEQTVQAPAPEQEETIPAQETWTVELREEGAIAGRENITYRLPKLNGDAGVQEAFTQWVDSAFDAWKSELEWRTEITNCALDFKTATRYNILSVEFFENEESASFWGVDNTFSIDLRTGEELTVAGILHRASASQEQLEDFIRADLQLRFDYEDSHYGEIQDIQSFRQEMLSSENLKKADAKLSVCYDGEIRLIVPNPYYINTFGEAPIAVADNTARYVYLRNLSDLGGCIVEDASDWIADGETGTEGTFSYCLPRLTDDRFDTEAFNQWTESCFAEWKDSTKYTSDGLDKSLGYRAFVIGDVLSVMLTNENQYRARIWYTNPSICFSLTTGKRLELKDMMDIAGIPMEQLPDLLAAFVESVADSEERIYGSVEGIEEYHKAILSEENLAKTEFVLWPGDLSNTKVFPSDVDDADCYPAGCITLRVWIPYQITEINGIPTPEMRDGYMMNFIQIPELDIR